MRLLVFIALFIFAIIDSNASEMHYRLKRLTLADGLSHTDVLDIKQDSIGYIWLATYNGLNRYDGYKFKQFYYKASDRLSVCNRISNLAFEGSVLWMATDGGINKFNTISESFLTLPQTENTENHALLTEMPFKYIFVDSEKLKWALNESTIILIDDIDPNATTYTNASNFKNFPTDPSDFVYRKIIEDNYGNMWVATIDGIIQLARKDNGFEYIDLYYNFVKGKPGWKNFIDDMTINDKGQLIFSNSESILIHNLTIDQNGITQISLAEEIPMKSVTFKNGKRFDYNYISSINQNKETGYWFFSNGFIHRAKNIEQLYRPRILYNSTNSHDDYNLNTLTVSSLYTDPKGVLFIGTYENNFYIIDLLQKPFNWVSSKTVGSNFFPSGRTLRSIYEDYDGQLWISSANGIALYNKHNGNIETIYHAKDIANIPQKNIFIITGNNKNDIWIGTNNGFEIYNKPTKKTTLFNYEYLLELGFNTKSISHIAFDKHGQAWLGSPTCGIAKVNINGSTITEIQIINSTRNGNLLSNKINYIYSDTAKNELIASTDKGFSRILLDVEGNIKKVIKYVSYRNTSAPLASDMIFPIDKLNDSTYYMGTLGGGLNKVVIKGNDTDSLGFGEYSSTAYGVENGLLSQDVEGLIIDESQRVWCAGNTLSVFDPVSNKFTNYNKTDGIKVEAFKVNTYFKGRDNTFYFGGVDGLTFFKPKHIKLNQTKPKIAITELIVNDKIVSPSEVASPLKGIGISHTKHLQLKHYQNNFSLSFSAMHYANPSNCIYKFKLYGFDKDWRNTNPGENIAQYSNLPYGSYLLEVYGTNNDGLWSERPVTLQINIMPPWHQTKLAMVFYILLIIAFFIFIYYNQYRLYLVRQKLKFSELEEAKKEELLNSKLQFFTNISHEFRTPLTFIISPLLELKSKTNDADLKQSLVLALKYANRLLRLIDQLIKFRKTESGMEKTSLSFVNINDFVRGIANSFTKPASDNNISLKIELCEQPMHHWTDATKLETILYNLLSNSFKSVRESRNVNIKILSGENAKLPIDNRKNQFRIASEKFNKAAFGILVSDTGIGISKDSLSSIFSRFYNINSENHIGYGIGLALLKNYVLLLNGSIEIASQRDIGTDFLICFPKNLPNSESDIENSIIFKDHNNEIETIELRNEIEAEDISRFFTNTGKGQTILIVEDNHELRNYLYTKLSKSYRVIEAINGIEGIEKAEQDSPDIIVSDVMMPQMDGITMCQHLKNEFSTCHIPILLLTAKSEIEDQIKGLLYGADDYIPKPFSMDYLLVKIQTTLLNREKVILKYSNDAVLSIKNIVSEKNHADLVEKVVDTIKNRMAEPNFALDSIYTELGMSRSVFFAKIKEATQQTPADFVKHIRLKFGLHHLLNNEGKINEAAMYIGMTPSNFTREFKRVFKKTPSEFLSN